MFKAIKWAFEQGKRVALKEIHADISRNRYYPTLGDYELPDAKEKGIQLYKDGHNRGFNQAYEQVNRIIESLELKDTDYNL